MAAGKLRERLYQAWVDVAGVDYRSLAAFRIGLGLVLVFDLLTKAMDITAFYTDRGILPRELAIQELGWWSFSFHLASGSYGFQLALFLIGILLSVALTVGYQTRLVTILLWVFTLSLQARNSLILHSGDALIRVMLFWSIFLPLGARYSLDRILLNVPRKFGILANLATLSILAQLLYMYFFTALLKDHGDWTSEYLAVYYALNLGQFTTPIGHLLRDHLALTKLFTFGTYYLELLGPALLVIPFAQRYVRWVVPFGFIGLHLGLFLTMYLGLFPWICIVSWFLFLPGDLVERAVNFVRRSFEIGPFARKIWLAYILPTLPLPSTWSSPRPFKWLARIFVLASLISVTLWNVGTIKRFGYPIPKTVRKFALPLRLDQYWSMFAPFPMRADGWFVIDGLLKDGSAWDTWNKMPPPFELPREFFPLLRSTQWRKYLTNVWLDDEIDKAHRLQFGRYVCREWNDLSGPRSEERQLATYQLYFIRKITPLPGEIPVFKRLLLWDHDCFATKAPSENTTPRRIGD